MLVTFRAAESTVILARPVNTLAMGISVRIHTMIESFMGKIVFQQISSFCRLS